jgi:cytochrome o ubiquinol oxidase subunit 1
MKTRGYERPVKGYIPIHMPKNTGTGVILSGISVAFAFGMIWYIWWLAAIAFVAIIGVSIFHSFNYDRDYYIPADEVSHEEGERTRLLATTPALAGGMN